MGNAAKVDPKQQLIKRIHAQAREVQNANPRFDTETRRLGQLNLVGEASTSDMDIGQLHQVSAWLAKLGGKVRQPKGGGRALSLDAQAQKLRAIWLELHGLGIVRDPSEAALCSWASNSRSPNVTSILEMLAGTREMDAAIERLKQWRSRELCKGQLFCPQCRAAFRPSPRQARAFPRLVCDRHEPAVAYQWRKSESPHPSPLPQGERSEGLGTGKVSHERAA
ncbi:phage protein GemA/Gp16 family protein [Methylogaea oryzae]|uniref:Regulatory protein GemA n=1 Tax=Methylogaea oryzae TaxID=1295382 RepID=A0A8D5AGZ4_9GAMM|nr:phage protein GemA/Gp16 family protein [Methylogaea oryzae]BBL69731.1 hypothetical protein MoryE10_03370 [Methylogaea oryzae]